MALRNQPYIPLYVQDFMTDEKLAECSAESVGVYIRLMCLMHKSDEYGCILLKQKDKQSDKQIKNFCLKIAKHIAYNFDVIERAITELVNEGVLKIEEDKLYQKRMVKDAQISENRANSGAKGGKKTQENIKGFAKAKSKQPLKQNIKQNTEYEYAYEIESESESKLNNKKKNTKKFIPPTLDDIKAYCKERNNDVDPQKFYDFYTSADDELLHWIDSKGKPVQNWKQKIITWEGNTPKPQTRSYSNKKSIYSDIDISDPETYRNMSMDV